MLLCNAKHDTIFAPVHKKHQRERKTQPNKKNKNTTQQKTKNKNGKSIESWHMYGIANNKLMRII
jgi:hypothetical protein